MYASALRSRYVTSIHMRIQKYRPLLKLFFNVSAAAAQTPASRNWKLFVSIPCMHNLRHTISTLTSSVDRVSTIHHTISGLPRSPCGTLNLALRMYAVLTRFLDRSESARRSTTQCHRDVLPFHDPNTVRPIYNFSSSLHQTGQLIYPLNQQVNHHRDYRYFRHDISIASCLFVFFPYPFR